MEGTANVSNLARFIRFAEPGDCHVYFVGAVTHKSWKAADPFFAKAWEAYRTGWFDLTQKRHGPDNFEYRITRRRTREPVNQHDTVRYGFAAPATKEIA